MSRLLIGAAKGSPGVSTLAWESIARWPREVVGVEVDLSGGSWALRYGLSHEPGLFSLTAAVNRSPVTWELLENHGHRLGRHGLAVCATPGRESQSAFAVLEPYLRSWPQHIDLILDVGRITDGVTALCRSADLVVLLTKPVAEDVAATKVECDTLLELGCRVQLVVVGEQPYSPTEVAAACGVALVDGSIPFDSLAMARFVVRKKSKRFDAAYGRIVRHLAEQLAFRPVQIEEEAY